MQNLKRSAKRLLTRLTIVGLVVICGAIAIAQVQKQNAAAANGTLATGQSPQLNLEPSSEESPGTSTEKPKIQGLPVQTPTTSQPPTRWGDIDVAPLKPEGETRFVQDPDVQPTQATQDFGADDFPVSQASGNDFENPFPPAPATDDAPAPFEPPDFGEAPELTSTGDGGSLEDGPKAPSSNRFDTGFPPADFATDAPFPAATAAAAAAGGVVAAQAPAAPRFDRTDNAAQELPEPVHPLRGSAGASQPTGQGTTPDFNRFGGAQATQQPPADVPSSETGPPSFPDTAPTDAADSVSSSDPGMEFGNDQNSVSLSGNGRPGPRELEGPQTASVTVHKQPPAQLRVDEPATFRVSIRNNGAVAAERVIIRDQVPEGTELVETTPQAKAESGGGIYWEIGTLQPNQEVTVTMQVLPKEEQLVGSVAVVSFETLASAQGQVRRPALKIQHTTAQKVLVGETVRFAIVIENPGTGIAKNVMIEEDVPEGLSHSSGPRLDYQVGDIPPGGQRRLELSLKAAKAGVVTNLIRARGENDLVAEHTVDLQVVAPQLNVRIEGPSTRYLERRATYTMRLENHGTANAKNVDLVVQLPRGLQFVSTESQGRYDSASNTVRWLLRDLPAGEFAPVQLTVNPRQMGSFAIKASATADRGLSDKQEHALAVEGIAALLFEVADQVDPIEVGGVTSYRIQVTNQGTKAATDVQFVAQVPAGLTALQPGAGAKYELENNPSLGQIIRFQPISQLGAKEQSSYTVKVKGVEAGDQRFKVQMTSADTPTPVIKEESTRVYSDH